MNRTICFRHQNRLQETARIPDSLGTADLCVNRISNSTPTGRMEDRVSSLSPDGALYSREVEGGTMEQGLHRSATAAFAMDPWLLTQIEPETAADPVILLNS
jgi:hypothetical protein